MPSLPRPMRNLLICLALVAVVPFATIAHIAQQLPPANLATLPQ